jgi:hypothetical protein
MVGAVGVGLSLGIGTAIEATSGIRSLIRVDILMFWVLYGLTFLEFLFPQPDVDTVLLPAAATNGTYAALLGFAGLAVGRHLVPRRGGSQVSAFFDVSPASFFFLFILATLLGYLHIFLAVNFDLFEALRQMLLPRFSQSWARGRYGDIYALLYEMGALIYLIPPIAGLMYARSKDYNAIQKTVVTVVLIFTLYYGFASGTRNILATYVITFLGAYFLNKSELRLSHVLYRGVPIFVLLMLGMSYMLHFREGGLGKYSFDDERAVSSLYIDRNMVVISRLTQLFPNLYGFLGFEIPFQILVHPIPRVLWPGKPEGLSVSVEEILGADSASVTFASTFIGESYISGGFAAILVAGLLLGAGAELWNRLGRKVNSPFSQLLYASGFLCAAITMRGLSWLSVMALPTLALWIYGRLWRKRSFPRRPNAIGRPNP